MKKLLKKRQADGWLKDELAEYYGLKSYDCALPQPWLNQMTGELVEYTGMSHQEIYELLRCGTVWHYPEGSIFGEAFYFFDELDVLARVVTRREEA